MGLFERSLSADHLRAYLKRLPDFDDIEAEQRALDFAMGAKDHLHALHFLIGWPALDRAAMLVEKHAGAWDGNFYEILTPAAAALEAKRPLGATILRRAMIDYTLDHSKSTRYRHAARHLAECDSLAAAVDDFGALAPHKATSPRFKQSMAARPDFGSMLCNNARPVFEAAAQEGQERHARMACGDYRVLRPGPRQGE